MQVVVGRVADLPQVRGEQMATGVADPCEVCGLVERIRAIGAGEHTAMDADVDEYRDEGSESPDSQHPEDRRLGTDQLSAAREDQPRHQNANAAEEAIDDDLGVPRF